MENYYTTMPSPVGELVLTSTGKALTGIYPPENSHYESAKKGIEDAKPFKEAIKQLKEYFSGKRTEFDLEMELGGTDFQKKVWNNLKKIPAGKTISYKTLAKNVGNSKASRAAGSANGKNPVCIIIPCHRVIGADGRLGGYNGGLEVKQWLLDHEKKMAG